MKEDKQPFSLPDFLKRFSLFIYTGDKEGDLLLLEDEIKELHQLGMIDKEEYLEALAALKQAYK